MNKRILVTILTMTFAFSSLVGCGNKENLESETSTQQEENKEEVTPTVEESQAEETEEEETVDTLPAYEYPGPELFYSVLYGYVVEDLGQYFDNAGVLIPSISIINIDESNKEDQLVYGDYWIYSYRLNGQTLECTAGGDFPGVIHIKQTDDGYEVTGFDRVEDGSNFDSSAKELFGENYDAFMELSSNSDEKEKVRAQIIANYVFANDLDITEYQDTGWDPVQLPEQNIDTFYSDL